VSAPVVAEICRRLDGIPLALELAAARVRVLGVDQILVRLGDRFRLLTASGAGVDARQQTLRAVIQWSADPLTAEEARLFQAFSVFRGSWSLESGVAVSGPDADEFEVLDALQRLAERSLVVPGRDAAGDARYRYLESVRQFAAEGLAAAGAAEGTRDRHLAWFLGLAERAQGGLVGPDQRAWSARLDLEHEDVLAAYAWSGGRPGGVEKGLRIAAAMSRYWSARGHYGLARRTLGDALARPDGAGSVTAGGATGAPPSVRATALVRAAGFALYEGDSGSARGQLEDALALYRSAGDAAGVARALTGLATEAVYRRDYDRARACYEETLAAYRAARNPHATAIALHNLGYIALLEGDPATARTRYEEAVHLFEGTGDDRHLGHTLGELGRACARLGDAAEARARIAAALLIARDLGARREGAYGLEGAAELAAARGETGLAIAWLETALALRERLGITVVPAEREQQEAFRSRLRARLGAAEAERAAASGRGHPFEEAVGASLAWLEGPAAGG
jgi:tetratricopeptide (TPR) repeat protein